MRKVSRKCACNASGPILFSFERSGSSDIVSKGTNQVGRKQPPIVLHGCAAWHDFRTLNSLEDLAKSSMKVEPLGTCVSLSCPVQVFGVQPVVSRGASCNSAVVRLIASKVTFSGSDMYSLLFLKGQNKYELE